MAKAGGARQVRLGGTFGFAAPSCFFATTTRPLRRVRTCRRALGIRGHLHAMSHCSLRRLYVRTWTCIDLMIPSLILCLSLNYEEQRLGERIGTRLQDTVAASSSYVVDPADRGDGCALLLAEDHDGAACCLIRPIELSGTHGTRGAPRESLYKPCPPASTRCKSKIKDRPHNTS